MDFESLICITIAVILFPILLAILRLMWILPALRLPQTATKGHKLADLPHETEGSNMMILLGSGGHTGEMMRIVSKMDLTKLSRTWVYSSGDSTSIVKAKNYEENNNNQFPAKYLCIPRARKVGEPLISSVFNTLFSFLVSALSLLILKQKPSVLLLNGPGTSVPIAYILFALKYLGLCNTKIIYIESLARVNKLSLSGSLLLPICDRFIVQWEPLYLKYKRVEYYGILI
ncbi:UDP-N-acetylglucosamine transferase subunit ALG14 [Spathaspora sp. JA1]|nr:UDP-N-acetylglucosamine transferase subunit ALG14 [Spathaspora sp. JA1]